MSEQFSVWLEKEQLIFSAAHFITFAGNICESIHGHNYRVRCEVTGKLDENGYVVDFIALRDALDAIVRRLDHKVLLPSGSSLIKVETEGEEVVATFEQRRWVFPKDNCLILPVSNTTAELMAKFIAEELMKLDDPRLQNAIDEITVGVDENEGQWGTYRTSWQSGS
ncbi:MAG: 6-pyruvoyl tetrahydropterin synthase family protein [Mariniblastus sp.]|nr:6-pyruvoyl tetrahydropterin synthase family protein [Mariniblastus sp.]